jgi:hypothetical protein
MIGLVLLEHLRRVSQVQPSALYRADCPFGDNRRAADRCTVGSRRLDGRNTDQASGSG